MTKIFNEPAEFADDQLAGFLDLYDDRVRGVPGGVVALPSGDPQVAVVVGGGSGHYPAFCGIVGQGFATGAVVGNIFTSPSASQVYSVAKAADQGHGVVLTFGNYAGDNLNFGLAAKRLRRDGIDTRVVVVTDDVASSEDEEERRGIAGDFTVFKVMGAAAAAGQSLDDVEELGRAANSATRSIGVAFDGCTLPGSDEPLFTVKEGHLGLGLGIHGEPGIRDEPMPTARELAGMLVDAVLEQAPSSGSASGSTKVAAILNGLGRTKYEELFLLWSLVADRLREAGLELVEPEVGELVTSLDMGGCSLTLMWLDDDLERLWRADAYTPAYRRQRGPIDAVTALPDDFDVEEEQEEDVPSATSAARELAPRVRDGLQLVADVLHEHEKELGDMDAVAGDGDHGRGMVKGADAALAGAEKTLDSEDDVGGSWALTKAGRAWADEAGGTSGVLWGAALEACADSFGDDRDDYTAEHAAAAVRAFATAITDLGGATPGDKTLVDSLLPFVDDLESQVGDGKELRRAWQHAAEVATKAAEGTKELSPKLGRARPLADKSVGTPDPGATSMAMVLTALGDLGQDGKASS